MQVRAKHAYQATNEAQLSFPAGAVIERSPENDGRHAPRNGWMHGVYQNQRGWFPSSYVEPIGGSTNRTSAAADDEEDTIVVEPFLPSATAVPLSAAAGPPVAQAIPVPSSASAASSSFSHSHLMGQQPQQQSSKEMYASMAEAPPPPEPLSENQLSQLLQQGFTRGLATSLDDTLRTFAKRIWVVDNSGSMQQTDGHKLVESGRRHHLQFVTCSRWEEITECVLYHIQLAALLNAPTTFRLLNNPGAHVGPQQFTIDPHSPPDFVQNALHIIKKTRPGGCTPLTDHILAIHAEVEAMSPQLQARGQKVAVIIATDGLPTDERGYGGQAHQDQFVNALRMLEGFPVWVVIRLCTDEEKVVEFYNDLDQVLELSIEVLDDFCGEAEEVHEQNPWLNYALPLHRLREMGFHDRVFDMVDERRLTKSELRDFCCLLMGGSYTDGMPDPSLDWAGFLRCLDSWLKQKEDAPEQWDPLKKKVRPWLDLHKMNYVYGDGSCVIL